MICVRIIDTLGHEKGDSEASLSDSLSESRKAVSVKWKRATDKNIKHHTKALQRKEHYMNISDIFYNVNAYSVNRDCLQYILLV